MKTGSLRVKEGNAVSGGTRLGTEGATGKVTGRHLHFEMSRHLVLNQGLPRCAE